MYRKTEGNPEQRSVLDYVLNIIDKEDNSLDSKCIYLDGMGGTGKTFVYEALTHLFNSRIKKVKNSASTGIAATLLPKGTTAYKTFGLNVNLDPRKRPTKKLAEDLADTDAFQWDEAPMSNNLLFEIADEVLVSFFN